MTSLIYNTGTVSVTNGSAVVTGALTGWAVALVTGGTLSVDGLAVPIASVESDTSLTLAYDWPGTSGSGKAYAIARDTSEAVRAAWTNDRLATIIQRLSLVGIHPDGSGTIAERDALDPVPDTGYIWLYAEAGHDLTFYRKIASGWEGPFDVRGATGAQGPAGVGEGGYGLPAGGAIGQALVKASATDGDAGWAEGVSPVYVTKAVAEAITPASAPAFIDIAGRDSVGDGRGGRFVYHGTTAPSHIRWLKITLADGVTDAYYVSTRPAVVYLASGQSNMQLGGTVAGLGKPNNIYLWNMLDPDTDPLGDAFEDAGGDWATISLCYAAEYAREHPEADVYVINVSRYSYGIEQWLPDPATGLDMYAILKANVEAALVLAGAEKVDDFIWWQGEGDYNSTTYVTDWITLYSRLLGETWFGPEIPVTLFGISTFSTPSLGNGFNKNLTRIAAAYPNVIKYFHTASGFAADWDPTNDYAHLLISSIPKKAAGAYHARRYSALWTDPYYNIVGADGFMAGRASPAAADLGAGVYVGNDGIVDHYAAGTGTTYFGRFYNNADVSPTLLASIHTDGTNAWFEAVSAIVLSTPALLIPAATRYISLPPQAVDDAAAAVAGVAVGGVYLNGSVQMTRIA